MDPGTSPTNYTLATEEARQLVKLKGYEQTGVHCHSLLAETERGGMIKRFREFVIFDGKYTYPEFLLAYKRVARSDAGATQPAARTGVRGREGRRNRTPRMAGEEARSRRRVAEH